jgi:glutathione synthase/RimK-type ligase-like ATP-grasp enzyme
MWRFSIGADEDALVRRVMPLAEDVLGLPVFPDRATRWHYDDKIAQSMLFALHRIPTPESHVFWRIEDALDHFARARYPLVLKLSGGASSHNVQLVASEREARDWARLLFGRGAHHLANHGRHTRRSLLTRLRESCAFLFSGTPPHPGHAWRLHKNYVYVQEFVPGNSCDIRITVIGGRIFGFRRMNRPGDFRASGSGLIDHNPAEVPEAAVRLGARVARQLGAQALALDIVRRETGFLVIEASCAFASWAVEACPGHWTIQGCPESGELRWTEGRVGPEDAIFDDFIGLIDRTSVCGADA